MLRDFAFFYFKAETIYTQDSPTLYTFCLEILDSKQEIILDNTRAYQRKCLQSQQLIDNSYVGEKSKVESVRPVSISNLAKSASSNMTKCTLLVRLAIWSGAQSILELGTNLGMVASALSENGFQVTTVEGNHEIYELANDHFVNNKTCKVIHNIFSAFFKNNKSKYDMIIIDGDHSLEATIENIHQCKYFLNPEGIIIIDDIRWSSEMKKCWNKVKKDTDFNLFIDVFMLGIIGYKSHQKTKLNIKLLPKVMKPWPYYFFRL